MVDFNNGFITALGLFYGHRESHRGCIGLTLYGAADHLYDIEYPDNLNKELKKRIENFADTVFAIRLDNDISEERITEIFDECKDIMIQIDIICFGLKDTEVKYP